ncbi:MAG TPA: hypothetical protein VFW22_15200 [Pseudolabrys sp.]|nr:hypothetical protein [Pseudolabrys sp.]
MLKPALFAAALAAAAAQPAFAEKVDATYQCKVTADGKVIMAVTNPHDFNISCSLNCHFKFPGGMASTSCSKTVLASATNQEICVKSTGGDKYTLRDSNMDCYKQ